MFNRVILTLILHNLCSCNVSSDQDSDLSESESGDVLEATAATGSTSSVTYSQATKPSPIKEWPPIDPDAPGACREYYSYILSGPAWCAASCLCVFSPLAAPCTVACTACTVGYGLVADKIASMAQKCADAISALASKDASLPPLLCYGKNVKCSACCQDIAERECTEDVMTWDTWESGYYERSRDDACYEKRYGACYIYCTKDG